MTLRLPVVENLLYVSILNFGFIIAVFFFAGDNSSDHDSVVIVGDDYIPKNKSSQDQGRLNEKIATLNNHLTAAQKQTRLYQYLADGYSTDLTALQNVNLSLFLNSSAFSWGTYTEMLHQLFAIFSEIGSRKATPCYEEELSTCKSQLDATKAENENLKSELRLLQDRVNYLLCQRAEKKAKSKSRIENFKRSVSDSNREIAEAKQREEELRLKRDKMKKKVKEVSFLFIACLGP